MTILIVYSELPKFPSTDQHPDAKRYHIGDWWVDALGPTPTVDTVFKFLNPNLPPDLAPYQFRAMLKLSGKQDALYAFIEALPEPQKTIAQSKLEFSLVFKRDNDLVLGAQSALGLTDAELDGLWQQASTL